MPRSDKTGPQGKGPMTGRRMGTCASNTNQDSNPERGFGNGFGRGMKTFGGRGFGRSGGRGFGRGYANLEETKNSETEILTKEMDQLKKKLTLLESQLSKDQTKK